MLINLRSFIGFVILGNLWCCKTTDSQEKSIPVDDISRISREEWVEACQKELANPTEGANSRQELQRLANTDDCDAAYPIVKSVVESLTKR